MASIEVKLAGWGRNLEIPAIITPNTEIVLSDASLNLI
ncbi:hypothetical protein LEP1GSC059_0502 [Leptospira noguchii serovar Panama str. CZ214]|uniref:Uncharacterized protein n=1 Tax=Leptospira noguchii serovar Panama str. CZ214 TaxID=1001595 RepID=T0H2E1_9LEPT|nr:hypothetical protein LEP1GSC059_0502 [Leptospira noguchii serovar Panama str. CZ214]